jgi:A/G-specific adenine glycosylase
VNNFAEPTDAAFFRSRLLEWYQSSHRPLPWKGEKDPYIIWLSEIILQQTRVEQGLPYFHRFAERYPRVQDLADAPEDEVMKLWEGLGYYSRARNMHAAAKYIVDELGGQFPNTYQGILQLKGVGPYTAAAIASFAFDLPRAVLDGNVFRVLSRFFGIDQPIDSSAGKKQFKELAQLLLDPKDPARYNQAIMDFGATHCRPQKPLCAACPFLKKCQASQQDRIQELPIKSKKIRRRTRFFHYLVINQGAEVWIRKRTGKDIWKNLYEFPMVEMERSLRQAEEIIKAFDFAAPLHPTSYQIEKVSPPYQQLLTHQKIVATFVQIRLKKPADLNSFGIKKIDRKNLGKFAFPKLIDCYLKDKSLYLNL